MSIFSFSKIKKEQIMEGIEYYFYIEKTMKRLEKLGLVRSFDIVMRKGVLENDEISGQKQLNQLEVISVKNGKLMDRQFPVGTQKKEIIRAIVSDYRYREADWTTGSYLWRTKKPNYYHVIVINKLFDKVYKYESINTDSVLMLRRCKLIDKFINKKGIKIDKGHFRVDFDNSIKMPWYLEEEEQMINHLFGYLFK